MKLQGTTIELSDPTISKIMMKLQGTTIELTKGSLSVNGQM